MHKINNIIRHINIILIQITNNQIKIPIITKIINKNNTISKINNTNHNNSINSPIISCQFIINNITHTIITRI